MRISALAAMAAALVLASACQPQGGSSTAAQVTAERLAAAESDGANWMNYGRTYSEQRHSPLDQVSLETVSQLGLAWFHEFETDRGHQATPVVVDGTLYTTTSWSMVHAFDAATGALKWSYDPKVPGETAHKACCDVVNRGVAVWAARCLSAHSTDGWWR